MPRPLPTGSLSVATTAGVAGSPEPARPHPTWPEWLPWCASGSPKRTPQQVAAYLKDNAECRGTVPNNTWGHGFAQLPATAVGRCDHELTADGTTSGQWSARCQSAMLGRGYAQYYSFNLEGDTQVTIDLESRLDPYLFLRAGEARSGNFLLENDDVEAGANTNSRITTTLAAGTYTIEATTYYAEETGSFTLTIADLDDGSGDSGATPDDCGATIGAEATISGTWSSVCQSAESNRGYARYYTFTVDQQSQVTIDLVSVWTRTCT